MKSQPVLSGGILSINVMKILFATSNEHKISEANEIGKEYGIEFEAIIQDYPEVRAESVLDVALAGIEYVYPLVGKPVIVEDSGLFIDGLSGFPGAYSSFVYERIGNDGILRLMEGVADRSARFVSAIGYCDGKKPLVFDGAVEGTIATGCRGTEGFGYDPVFMPNGSDETFATDPVYKNKVSHRKVAFDKLCSELTR
ncbi:XTP/dITP diphosphatase [Candidatus Altiarchaeota archaeon]